MSRTSELFFATEEENFFCRHCGGGISVPITPEEAQQRATLKRKLRQADIPFHNEMSTSVLRRLEKIVEKLENCKCQK